MPHANETVFRGAIHDRIHEALQDRLRELQRDRGSIGARLAELDAEWDLDRLFFLGAGAVVLATGLAVAMRHRRVTAALPAGAFLLARALAGWAPPLALLRQFGVRSRQEIEHERIALRALRGDFGRPFGPRRAFEVAEGADQG